jgi:hypothetical protein
MVTTSYYATALSTEAAGSAMANFHSNNNTKHAAKDAGNIDSNLMGPLPCSNWGMSPLRDQLNLSGLLNVLDGIVDSPGIIVIMTTNHLEMLDPALICPGSIDKKLLLGFMEADNVILMLEHYFQTDLTKV